MRLYLVRHAIAENVSATGLDADRGLTSEGKARMRGAAEGLRALDVRLDRILTSPSRRAVETAAILASAVADAEIDLLDALSPGAVAATVLAALRPYRQLPSVALVGHQPDLGYLASHIMTGRSDACPLPFKKGAVACFQTATTAGALRGVPEWFMTSKQLRAIAGR